jgi:polysaccharide export outer membrane protein
MACARLVTLVVFIAAATPATAPFAVAQSTSTTVAPTPATASPRATPAAYRIGPEDVLAVAVLEAPDLNRTLQVGATGDISLALIGTVQVAGLTTSEVEAAIAAKLREKYIRNPNVTVQVTEARSHTISVTGAVRKPGVFQIRSPKPLLEVIALAEGLAEDAGGSALVVRSGSGETVDEIKLKALVEGSDTKLNVLVNPGDVVKVTRQGVVYVVGDVKKPGAFPMRDGRQTVLSVLAQGEGLGPTAAADKSLILRASATGDREMVPIDVKSVIRGKSPDVALQAEDVLFIPQSGSKVFGRAAADAALRILSLRIPFVR